MSTGKIELSVGAIKIGDKHDMLTEEEISNINKIPVIEDELEESVKFKVVGEGITVPPINGVYDDTEIRELINETNALLDNKMNIVDGVLWVNEDLHSGSKIFSNVNVDLNHKTLNLERIELNNATLKNGNILVPNEKLIGKGKFKLSNITINSPTLLALSIEADDVIIENCDFTNVSLHFSKPKKIKILNNRFDVTVDNSHEKVGSKEFCHVTNSSLNLENCIIQGNTFNNSLNDCIDIFPTGHRTLISGNTFINCKRALELKSHHREVGATDGRTDVSVKGCIVENNFFCHIPNNAILISHYATDEIDNTDFSKYPNILYSNNIFSNDLGVDTYTAYNFRNINEAQIVNSKSTGDFDNNNGNFILLENSNVVISNSISKLKNFITPTSAGANNSGIIINSCIGNRLQGLIDVKISNSTFTRIYHLDNSCYILNGVTTKENLSFNKGVMIASNCIFPNVYDGVKDTEPTENTYVCFTNCISQNSIPVECDYCKISNFKKMPTIKI